jgi:hypothetical protein
MSYAPRSLYGQWPLTPSTVFPNEKSLMCPFCKSKNITLTIEPTGPGTGPFGRHRLGDPAIDVARCEDCGKKGYHGKTNLPR